MGVFAKRIKLPKISNPVIAFYHKQVYLYIIPPTYGCGSWKDTINERNISNILRPLVSLFIVSYFQVANGYRAAL